MKDEDGWEQKLKDANSVEEMGEFLRHIVLLNVGFASPLVTRFAHLVFTTVLAWNETVI